jgi:hypothetical protein
VRGGGFIGAAKGASTCGLESPRGRRRRAVARLRVEPESSSRSGKDPTGDKGERERGAPAWVGREGVTRLGRLGRAGVEKKKRPLGLGLAGGRGERGEIERESGPVGPRGRRKTERRRRRKWAGLKEKEREKKKNIQMHLNLNLKFKFKWKTRTMQCGMKCTRPIFPYISFMVK